MIAPHRRHHRAASRTGRHDGAAHGVPDIHEGQRPRGIRRHALHIRALGPDGREIVADPAALLHGQRRLAQHVEYAAHVIGHGAHDETVEQGDIAPRARPGGDATGGQIFEILQRGVELLFPMLRIIFYHRQRARDAAPAILNGAIDRRAIGGFQTVFHVPDLFGNRGGKAAHSGITFTWQRGRIHLTRLGFMSQPVRDANRCPSPLWGCDLGLLRYTID